MRARRLFITFVLIAALMAAPGAEAIHFYRGGGGGCIAKSGEYTDDLDSAGSGTVVATVMLGHNTYHDVRAVSPRAESVWAKRFDGRGTPLTATR